MPCQGRSEQLFLARVYDKIIKDFLEIKSQPTGGQTGRNGRSSVGEEKQAVRLKTPRLPAKNDG